MSEWYCPNEAHGDGVRGRHQFFTRRHKQIVEKTFLGNGRQWAMDKPRVVIEEPITKLVCATCGADAEKLGESSGRTDGGR